MYLWSGDPKRSLFTRWLVGIKHTRLCENAAVGLEEDAAEECTEARRRGKTLGGIGGIRNLKRRHLCSKIGRRNGEHALRSGRRGRILSVIDRDVQRGRV